MVSCVTPCMAVVPVATAQQVLASAYATPTYARGVNQARVVCSLCAAYRSLPAARAWCSEARLGCQQLEVDPLVQIAQTPADMLFPWERCTALRLDFHRCIRLQTRGWDHQNLQLSDGTLQRAGTAVAASLGLTCRGRLHDRVRHINEPCTATRFDHRIRH